MLPLLEDEPVWVIVEGLGGPGGTATVLVDQAPRP